MNESSTLILAGGTVVSGGAEPRVIHDGAVAVEGANIGRVGPAREVRDAYPGARVLDTGGKLVMPGLVNAHTHLYSALARGLIADIEPSANFTEILEHLWWRLDRALTMDDIRSSAAAGAIDLIRNGTTTIIDHHASQVNIDGSLSEIADVLEGAGLRANLCFEVTDRDGESARDAGLRENERFADELRGRRPQDCGPGMLGASVGLHASFTLDDETLDRAVGTASERGLGCHIHVAEDAADVEDSLRRSGKRVVERLDSHGVLGPRTVAVHCIHVDDSERRVLRDTETIVVHNPQSNMNNAVGCADVPGLLDDGVLVGLGTDGFSASMFDEMKVANLIHRDRAGDPRAGHGLPGRLCLTNNGLMAGRLFGARLGLLAEGSPADVIVLDYDPPTPVTSGNFEGHVIFGLTGWMVESVMVNGRMVMRDREILTMDAEAVLAGARERALALWRSM
ncbi:MAG: putative aminohydrolase SsnA [Candidatus Eisenbacteria bacterium]